jgi:hypothetical protein
MTSGSERPIHFGPNSDVTAEEKPLKRQLDCAQATEMFMQKKAKLTSKKPKHCFQMNFSNLVGEGVRTRIRLEKSRTSQKPRNTERIRISYQQRYWKGTIPVLRFFHIFCCDV